MALPFHRPREPLLGAKNQRQLDDSSYLVDSGGNAYQAYSLSWRYLGLFIDCDSGGRRLEDGDDNACQRKVLWAAYHDANYRGGSIGEYSFYDRSTASWDASTCRPKWNPFARRCQRLNCHEAGTKFELVGVFKETDGLYDWTEQLFKHQGYCLWDGDKNEDGSGSGDSGDDEESSDYNFMSNLQQNWVSGCAQLDYVDANGNALYVDTKPQSGGDMTYGVYTDATCLTESSLTWSDVTSSQNDGSGDQNNDGGYITADSIDRWNELLGDYKICQPCRAYNRVKTSEGGSHSESSGSGSGDEEDGDDGEGGKEQWGFNCYDAAGYRNCNQCYKFETQTDMEPASTQDLELATKQGTILAVKVGGTTYGSGYYKAAGHKSHVVKRTFAVLLSTAALAGLAYFYYKRVWKRRRDGNVDLKEGLTGATAPCDQEDGVWYDSWYGRHFWPNTNSSPTNDSDSSSTSPDNTEELLAQIQERDAKLAQQEQLIHQLQLELDSYKSIAVVEGISPTSTHAHRKGSHDHH